MSPRRARQVAAAVAALVVLVGCGGGDDPAADRPDIAAEQDDVAADHQFVIPQGTGERMDAGNDVEIIPASLTVRVGEVLRIINQDERGHTVGAFYVGAGETLTQRFASPGVLAGECSVHPSGEFTLTVEG